MRQCHDYTSHSLPHPFLPQIKEELADYKEGGSKEGVKHVLIDSDDEED
jgi:hypothetical protein